MTSNISNCFVVMPIENTETEFLWDQVYAPVTAAAGLTPRRVDKEGSGAPLILQIFDLVRNSPIIIADVTMARPNCYLEIGYALGLGKYDNVILTCREDHNPDSPRFGREGHKLHFDLNSFPVLWWVKNDLADFRERLKMTIDARKKLVMKPIPVPQAQGLERLQATKNHQAIKSALEDLVKKARKESGLWIKPN